MIPSPTYTDKINTILSYYSPKFARPSTIDKVDALCRILSYAERNNIPHLHPLYILSGIFQIKHVKSVLQLKGRRFKGLFKGYAIFVNPMELQRDDRLIPNITDFAMDVIVDNIDSYEPEEIFTILHGASMNFGGETIVNRREVVKVPSTEEQLLTREVLHKKLLPQLRLAKKNKK